MIKNDKTNRDEKYKNVEKIHDKIKFKAFGKVTIRQRRIPKDKLEVVGKDTATELLEAQQKRAQSEIEDIEKTKGGKVRKVWEIKKKVLGGKKTDVEATAIINPKTGNLALSKGEIKKVSLQYTKETLMSNPIEEGVAEEIEQKKVATRKFLKESGGTFEINKEIFEKVLAKFKGSIKRNYDVIVRADKMFQEKVYELCQIMIQKDEIPSEFRKTTLHMIYKGKGKREDLSKNRFIHSKSWFPRLVEGLVVEGALKKPLVEKSSIFQIGGQPNHRPEELLFVMKSVIAKQRMQGKETVIQCYETANILTKK